MMPTLPAFETHTWCSEMEDYIGTESCVDLQEQQTDESLLVVENGGGGPPEQRRCCSDSERRLAATRRVKKEYPPPLSSPWVLKRYYTNDGRLIIKEENVGRHDYFKVHRANGRLTLQLQAPRDDEDHHTVAGDVEERQDHYDDDVECGDGDDDDDVESEDGGDESDGLIENRTVERAVAAEAVKTETTVVVGGGGNCYNNNNNKNNFSRVISSPCLFGMPVVPAIRPVHI
ncbi:hypothetical protein Vadar_002392 [Vaccinium darrowii]|uniref:Uncharacterized protein n=1 Tax=Vaccinium darrowii TaxID=229202 RepID=A0ACB7Y5L7_9ERIC|nr:hypothetical protein Vadar_002392 [Vaccinium darrowii]